MACTTHSNNITFQGLTPTVLSLMKGKEFGSATEANKRGILLQLIEGFDSLNPFINSRLILQALLYQFQYVFETSTGSPPIRTQDHHIEFQEGSKLVCVQLYRYQLKLKNYFRRCLAKELFVLVKVQFLLSFS